MSKTGLRLRSLLLSLQPKVLHAQDISTNAVKPLLCDTKQGLRASQGAPRLNTRVRVSLPPRVSRLKPNDIRLRIGEYFVLLSVRPFVSLDFPTPTRNLYMGGIESTVQHGHVTQPVSGGALSSSRS